MKKKRKHIPDELADEVLAANRHTCCICHTPREQVQLHHIDGDRSNSVFLNLAVLCLNCHSRVTGDEGLGRRYSPNEVSKYKKDWEVRCSRKEEEVDEPEVIDFEETELDAGEHLEFSYGLEAGDLFTARVSSDETIDALLVTERSYKKWADGDRDELSALAGGEQLLKKFVEYEVDRSGSYTFVIVNRNWLAKAKVLIDIAIWPPEN